MTATNGDGVSVTFAGTGTLTLSGSAEKIDAYLNDPRHILYSGAPNLAGVDAATITVTADDGDGAVPVGIIHVDITMLPRRLAS